MPDLVDWLLEHESSFRKSRLPSLYADLSVQKTTNPEGYSANVQTWRTALIHAAAAGEISHDQRLTLDSSEELLNRLASLQYGRPSGLGLVLDESVKSGKMHDLKTFKDMEQSIYHRSWVPSPWTVLKWGLKQAGLAGTASYDNSGRLRSGQLVLIPTLEDMYKKILAVRNEQGTNLIDRIMTREAFSDIYGRLNGQPLSQQDTDVLLCYLSRDKEMLSYDSKTVKFKSTNLVSPEPITTEDTTIANLKSLITSLQSQIINLNARILTLETNAKSAVQSKNKTAALSALRSKKIAETALQQRTNTLTQLEEVYSKIEQAVDQIQIVEVMQSSVSVLKGLNRKIGGVDRVEDVVEELREEMGKVDEVGQVLQEPLDGQMVIAETEVDDELEEMEKEERKKEEERETERTRQRLAELDAEKQKQAQAEREADAERKRRAEAEAEAEKIAEVELKLRDSIEQLGGMKLGKESNQDQQSNRQEQQDREHERVAEEAS